MDEKHKPTMEFLKDIRAFLPQYLREYFEISDESLEEISAEFRAADGVNHDLLLWIKVREVELRARLKRRPRPGSPGPDYVLPYDVYSGMVQAYHNVWQQVLFPGLSVQDGTLDPDEAARADKEWIKKAEKELRKTREG